MNDEWLKSKINKSKKINSKRSKYNTNVTYATLNNIGAKETDIFLQAAKTILSNADSA